MQSAFLEQTLKDVLITYHAPAIRYRHVAFSCKALAELDSVTGALVSLLPDFAVWRGGRPDSAGPPLTCSRREFIHEVFSNSDKGLIIEQPHYWWLTWNDVMEKQAFWSALSERHREHPVVVAFVEGNDFAELNQRYFISRELPGLPLKLWVSTKNSRA